MVFADAKNTAQCDFLPCCVSKTIDMQVCPETTNFPRLTTRLQRELDHLHATQMLEAGYVYCGQQWEIGSNII